MEALDKLDRHILRSLQADGRATYDQIAEAVGLSPSAVLRRVKRLEEIGLEGDLAPEDLRRDIGEVVDEVDQRQEGPPVESGEDEAAGCLSGQALQPCSASQRSASIAAMHPLPAAVIAWRYQSSWTSPAANTPSMLVREVPSWVSR